MAKSSKLANKFRLSKKKWGIHSYLEICSKIDFTGQARRPVGFEMIWSLTKQTWHTCGIFLLVAAAKKSLCCVWTLHENKIAWIGLGPPSGDERGPGY